MRSPRYSALVALVLTLGCTTVYQPPDAPPTEESLESAIRTLRESDADIEMLEDGLQLTAYLYRWTQPMDSMGFSGNGHFGRGSTLSSTPPIRSLVGPAREMYVPYARIQKVTAHSWPLWAGVEIDVSGPDDLTVEGPLVVEAQDVEEAQRLTDAIDTVRRVRLLSAAIDPEAVPPPD